MTQKLGLMRTAAVLVFILPSAAFAIAIAQADRQPRDVKKGAVAQQPTVVQQSPIATVGPVSQPDKWGALPRPQGVISVLLTQEECKNLGGTVNDVHTNSCASGKGCATAGDDGVIRTVCIDNKVN